MTEKKRSNNKPPQRVTIRDVAKAAGVSVSTVSHVLNNYGDIGPETEKRVRQTMKALNYYPSALARRLTRKRSHLLHLFLFAKEGLQHPFFYEVISGISKEAESRDYELILSVQQADDSSRRWRNSLRRSIESRVEGLIIMGSLPDCQVLEKIKVIQIPAMFIDIPCKGSNCIYMSSDNVRGARTAVEHLLSLGHEKIAFLGGDFADRLRQRKNVDHQLKGSVSQSRFEGYTQALLARGLKVDPSLIGHGEFTQKGAQKAVLKILEEHSDLTAIFAVSDLMAIGAIEAVRSVGKEIPEDIAVVGFDDIEAASFVRPLLTTIRQDGSLMGRRAVQEILRLINDSEGAPAKIVFPVELVVRESCGALPKHT